MKLSDLVKILNWQVLAGADQLDKEVTGAYVSDLLSDVIGFASKGQIWLTLQTHKNIVAVASLKDLSAILIVKKLQPDADTLAKAIEEEIPIISCADDTFEAAGKLYTELKKNDLA